MKPLFLLLVAFACAGSGMASTVVGVDSYTVVVPPRKQGTPGGRCLAAYSFVGQSIQDAFARVPDRTTLAFWNQQAQGWDAPVRFDAALHAWIEADGAHSVRALLPGTAFFIQNPSETEELRFVVSGTRPTGPVVIALRHGETCATGYAFPVVESASERPSLMVECTGGRYSNSSMGFPARVGDQIRIWDDARQDWVVHTRVDPADSNGLFWTGEGLGVSPTVGVGQGFLIVPAEDKNWIQSESGLFCESRPSVRRSRTQFILHQCWSELCDVADAIRFLTLSSLTAGNPSP
ncbi:MAG: hypothetical protein K9N62_18015 [Verrucomicrobia bacterium]|nr:hypothetical protein [Verrucomicrobiota bacterium]